MERAERVSVIQAIFGCSQADAEGLCDRLRLVRSEPASILAFQGDEAAQCQFVIHGSVHLNALGSDGQLTQVATVEPGEVFGSFPLASTYPVEVVAREALELFVIGTAELRKLAKSNAAIASGLASLFATQLAAMLGRLAARVTMTAKGRVYSELLSAADSDGLIAPAPVVSALAVKAQTARETASRAVSELDRRGILQKDDDRWQIVSRRMLEEMLY